MLSCSACGTFVHESLVIKKNGDNFCSEDCWNEWMTEPATMGCWSPPMAPKESLATVEALSLEN